MTQAPSSDALAHILLVEDDVELARAIAAGLASEFYEVAIANDGECALERLASQHFDLLLLDLLLPGISGLEVCRLALEHDSSLTVMVVTALSGVNDTVKGLEAGADDYLVKPFGVAELRARIRAVLRRGGREESPASGAEDAEPEMVGVGSFVFAVSREGVACDGRGIPLRPREEELLRLFLKRPGVVLTRATIEHLLTGAQGVLSRTTVDWHIHQLRHRLESEIGDELIENVYGLGWRVPPKQVTPQ